MPLVVVQMLTYLLCAFLIQATVFVLLFTTRNTCDQNTRILESKHHPFMSQYKHVVVSVYWSERVHEVTILSLQDRQAAGPPFFNCTCIRTGSSSGRYRSLNIHWQGHINKLLQATDATHWMLQCLVGNCKHKIGRDTDNTIFIDEDYQLIINDQHLIRGFRFSGMTLYQKKKK